MANFAKINNNNIVETVIVIDDKDCAGGQYPESEVAGQNFIKEELGLKGIWKQTSFNNNFRYNFAKPGMFFNLQKDAFYWKDCPDENMGVPLIFDEDKLRWYWNTPNPFALDENNNPIPDSEQSITQIRNYY
jgi:hypothetical protein